MLFMFGAGSLRVHLTMRRPRAVTTILLLMCVSECVGLCERAHATACEHICARVFLHLCITLCTWECVHMCTSEL